MKVVVRKPKSGAGNQGWPAYISAMFYSKFFPNNYLFVDEKFKPKKRHE